MEKLLFEMVLSISSPTILGWIRQFGMQHAKPVEPVEGAAVVLELDDVWHYLKKKVVDLESFASLYSKIHPMGMLFFNNTY
ncbi:hypothetical protein C6497_06815 [Candidatus Poribacteria bacterium]|nr:MAG: hypothetical protein C6497_06815 [Candidatus Poribacteria bacterium]